MAFHILSIIAQDHTGMYSYFTNILHYYTYSVLCQSDMLSLEVHSVLSYQQEKLSHTFPLPSFRCRMPCRLAFVPVENAYTTLCGNMLSTN